MSIEDRGSQYGNVFGRWQIGELIGRGSGGKSAVFRLIRKRGSWEENSALKVINLIEERGDPVKLPEFRRKDYEAACQVCTETAEQEVRLMENLRGNTNIVDYLDHDFEDWSDSLSFGRDMLIRMELLRDLRSALQSGKQFAEKEIIKVGRDICQALVLCHEKQILHRDIKPENIFINRDGNYKLGDFGISRILNTTPGAMASTGIGTPEYAAPEQGSGRYDHRVDIYSLGLVLYELANGNKLPFARSSYVQQEEVLRRQIGEQLPAPSQAAAALSGVILKACAFRPADRYQSAQEMLSALNALTHPTLPQPTEKPPQKEDRPRETGYETVPAVPRKKEDTPTGYQAPPREKGSAPRRDPYATEPAADVGAKKLPKTGDDYATLPWYGGKKEETEPELHSRRKRGTWKWLSVAVIAVAAMAGVLFWSFIHKRTPQNTGSTLDASMEHTFAVRDDGTVLVAGDAPHLGIVDVSEWRDIVSLSANFAHAVGLKANGTVVATGNNKYGQCDVSDWSKIAAVSAGECHTVGLKTDGTVIAIGSNEYRQCDVFDWDKIVAVSAGKLHTVGLKADGTVVTAGNNEYGQCDVSDWSEIVAVSAGGGHTVGLKADGTVIAAGYNEYSQCETSEWRDVVQISAGGMCTAGLCSDGTVVGTGNMYTMYTYSRPGSDMDVQEVLDSWSDIVAIDINYYHAVGLKADGTVVVAGDITLEQCDVSDWTDIRLPDD